ncbi:MAG: class I SAM-dependent methyltransferase [Candidatus Aenigmarchaeota archaeon]|nr:class I SAM-dependent methyltransferase [Candidatus Aenigmarchaeota archaeon]
MSSFERFQSAYEARPPWDIGRPQPEFVAIAGEIKGKVLDVGCGTGENALFLAQRGHEVWGIDAVPKAIQAAKKKAAGQKLNVKFLVHDALSLQKLGKIFDSIIDSGLFHVFSDSERSVFVKSLYSAMRKGGTYFMLCFSEHEPGEQGPRRIRKDEIKSAFAKGWKINYIRDAHFSADFGQPHAWLASITKP